MPPFLRLIRPINLFIIAFTMYLMRYAVVGGMRYFGPPEEGLVFSMREIDFFLLVLSTMLVAAAGYIINDYFDIRIDRINKPEKVIVGKLIKKRVAMLWHTLFNVTAVLIAVYLLIRYKNIWPLIFHMTTTFGLWMYSLSLKRQFLSGNITISIMAGMVVILSGLADIPSLREGSNAVPSEYLFSEEGLNRSAIHLWIFAGFAFLSTLIREIQKDMADVKGDEVIHCKTVPIVWGIKRTRQLINVLILLLVLPLFVIVFSDQSSQLSVYYISLLVILPILYSGFITTRSKERNDFLSAARWMKVAMFTAVVYSLFMS